MALTAILGEEFFRDAAHAAFRDFVGPLIPGSSLGLVLLDYVGIPFCKAAWAWLRHRQDAERQQAIDELTQIPIDKARKIIEEELHDKQFDTARKLELANYLSAIPMTARRAISRVNDGGTPTTLLSQLPRSYSDILRFIPLRPPSFQPEDIVPGHDYRLHTLIGQGGFAEVWKATHLLRETLPPFALKFCLDHNLLGSLRREIQVLDKLSGHEHPDDFVTLYETAYHANPPFVVFEYIDGGDLAGWLASFDGKRPSVTDVVRILKMTARGLAFAHIRGVIHRDLKPSNLLVTRQGRVKIADFGIGAIMADAQAQAGHNMPTSGTTFLHNAHTPLYVEHRHFTNQDPDPQDDIYALGVIGYQLLTGDISQPIGPTWRDDLEAYSVPENVINVISSCVDIRKRRFTDGSALLAALNTLPRNQQNEDQTGQVMRHRFCRHCGKELIPNAQFCNKCGTRVIGGQA